jgi:hypothetical protein
MLRTDYISRGSTRFKTVNLISGITRDFPVTNR